MKIKLKVKAHAGENSVEKIPPALFSEPGFEGMYYVKTKAPPEGGQANLELLKVLKKYFGKEVKILSGFTSNIKIVEVFDINI